MPPGLEDPLAGSTRWDYDDVASWDPIAHTVLDCYVTALLDAVPQAVTVVLGALSPEGGGPRHQVIAHRD